MVPGAIEVPADGVDQDCDGGERCWTDVDGDGLGGEPTAASVDVDCSDPGEFATADDPNPLDPDGGPVDTGAPRDTADPGGTTDSGGTTTDPGDPGETPPPVDGDGDGVVDAVDPAPADAGGAAGTAPPPPSGCATAPGGGWWVVALGGWARRRSALNG